ncbi:MAG: hypothetical protein K6G30_06505 [Acetatifactor sp.]|nr:hypothetical protein [Acetatifactor sp.]
MTKDKRFAFIVSTPIVSIIIGIFTIVVLGFMAFFLKGTMYYVISTEMHVIDEKTYMIEETLSEDLDEVLNDNGTWISAEVYTVEDPNNKYTILLRVNRGLNTIYWSGAINQKDKFAVEGMNSVPVYLKLNLGETYLINILKARLSHEK